MRIRTRLPVALFAAVNVYVLRKRFKTYSMLEYNENRQYRHGRIYESTLGRGSQMAHSTRRLTNEEAQSNGKLKMQLLSSNFQYIVLGPVEVDAAVREKPKIRIVSWIFDFYYGGKCVQCPRMESKSSVNRFWYVVNSTKCKCNKLSNLFNCLVLSHHKLVF